MKAMEYPDIIRVKNYSGSLSKLFVRTDTPKASEFGTPSEAWKHGNELVVLGDPHDTEDPKDPRYHDCDQMGCCTFSHVIERR